MSYEIVPGATPEQVDEFKTRVEAEKGRGTIRSKIGPWLMMCCWNQCDTPARREHMHAVLEGVKPSFYFFCSGRHRVMWGNSSKDMGNLPSGSRGMLL